MDVEANTRLSQGMTRGRGQADEASCPIKGLANRLSWIAGTKNSMF